MDVEPEPEKWRVLRLRMSKASGKLLEIRLARPMTWVDQVGAKVGGRIFLDLPEMGAVGEAEVLAVEGCPPLTRGPGNVVTGTFAHEADEALVTLELSENTGPLHVTDNHPFWSEDQRDFIPAGQLRQGERLRTRAGPARVVSVTKRPVSPGERVYNLEVHGGHVYEVTSAGVLVHNTCPVVGKYKLTKTVAGHLTDVVKKGKFKGELARPYLRSPHLIDEIMKSGIGRVDPGGVAGALRWDVPGTFRGSSGIWELVFHPPTNTILHFNFVGG
jgi:hypothetical protein